jgi:hypothetical protein
MNRSDSPEPNNSPPSDETSETRLDSTGEVVVEQHSTPPPGPADKTIHPRRPLPAVPTSTKEQK